MKISVVLLNLGGPDSLENVKPFLFNLFNDPAIIRLPTIPRFLIAKLISILRAKKAQSIYAKLGGASPLLDNTQDQADALKKHLNEMGNHEFDVHIAMRYWHPRAHEVAKELLIDKPDKVILLPLYPQYSTTTTKSSLDEFKELLKESNVCSIESYPDHPTFIQAHIELINQIPRTANTHLLFSAHGIPQEVVDRGDPYEKHVHLSVQAIMKHFLNTEYTICYQSKVGPKKWLGPNIGDCIKALSHQKKDIVVIPISFVSDHSETLVELDMDYAKLAQKCGASSYVRVPALGTHPYFIQALGELIKAQGL